MAFSDNLTPQGYLTEPPCAPLQPSFAGTVDAVCRALADQLGAGLDSVYVYGSVARGEAIPGTSDLDLTLLLAHPLTPAAQADLEQLKATLEGRHPEVSKIDFDVGTLDDALSPAHRYSWGYWLKHQCRHVWGPDRRHALPRHTPSRTIALAVNGDFPQVLARYRQRLAEAGTPNERRRLQREAARKLIRATHTLCHPDETRWPVTLEEHVTLAVERYPERADDLGYFLRMARDPDGDADAFDARLATVTEWMRAQLAETGTAAL
ncbi:nucleotidyltransferase domain-containing protein [Salinicola sp. JS01]|uniref:nucleotidyltransferase domain-containing protein n=1 Tax=Salinicola sp. JS01 TaxID=3050071 RepID=UPI00255C03D1|nr:nucleotidyltransferase domain-containing protein [Salinicola sp. JS01]WIX31670.1 nucleotidyltransferase domain-containing protein [Salinicola sp. JS01]